MIDLEAIEGQKLAIRNYKWSYGNNNNNNANNKLTQGFALIFELLRLETS